MIKLFLTKDTPKIKDIYLCTGEKNQVQIIANNEEEARRMFKAYHQVDDSEIVEVINMNEFYTMV